MASAARRDNLVDSIARVQHWAKNNKFNASKSEVQSNLTKVENTWLELMNVFVQIREQYGPNEMPFHENAERLAQQLYGDTSQLLKEHLETFVESGSRNIDWASEMENSQRCENKYPEDAVVKHRIHKAGLARVTKMASTIQKPSIHALNSLLDLLEEHWQGYMKNASAMFNADKMDVDIIETELDYLETKSQLKTLIADLQPAPVAIQEQTNRTATSHLKLPPIQIGKFDGNYKKWTAFHDLFEKLVNNDGNMSGAQKLYYLRSSLEGDAEQLIRAFEITDANYLLAWNALNARYQDRRMIINSHLKTLFGQATLETESAASLQKQMDSFSDSVNQLKMQGFPTEHWDSLLVFMFVQKLDPKTRRQWELSLTNDEFPTFKQLQTYIEARSRSLLASLVSSTHSTVDGVKNNKNRSNCNTNQQRSHHSMAICGPICPICKTTHFAYACPELLKMTSKERYQFAVDNELCFNCLRSNHSSKKCTSVSCRKCNGRHHTLLHHTEPSSNELPLKDEDAQNSGRFECN